MLTLKTGTGYALGSPVSATGSIADNDASSTVSIAATDASGAEAGSEPDRLHGHALGEPLQGGRRDAGLERHGDFGTDYTVSVSGGTLSADRLKLTLAAGATTATITITPIDDAAIESAETVSLALVSGTGYTLGSPSSASGSIADNDARRSSR